MLDNLILELDYLFKRDRETKRMIYEYLDNLDEKIDITMYLGDKNVHFINISGCFLTRDDGFYIDYTNFDNYQLYDLLREIKRYKEKEEK